MKRLYVYFDFDHIGYLEQSNSGQLNFRYLESCGQAISMSMPLGEKHGNLTCEAYFGGLLPESPDHRQFIARKFAANANSTFSLLRAIGHDCAGALSFHETEVDLHNSTNRRYKTISESELEGLIIDLPRKPLFLEVDEMRLSLAGAQEKAAVCLVDNQVALPLDNNPSTHIMKPAIDRFEETCMNEYFCMKLATEVGLDIPQVQLRQAGSCWYLLVSRFDRKTLDDGSIGRIHQEDFCQALGINTVRKYQNDGGPGHQQCFELLKRTTIPAVGQLKFRDAMIFNFLIGNGDAHGKNFALLHRGGKVALAPFYDLLSTIFYKNLSGKMAMSIDKKYDPLKTFPLHWHDELTKSQISSLTFKQVFVKMAQNIIEGTAILLARDPHASTSPFATTLGAFITKNCETHLKRFTG